MRELLNSIPNIPLAIGLISISAILGAAAVFVMRKWLKGMVIKGNNDAAGYIYQMLGVLFAVMLAFAILIVWEEFKDTSAAVDREANLLTTLTQVSRALPEPAGAEFRANVVIYARSIVDSEWNAMAIGQSSAESDAALSNLAHFIVTFQPATAREEVIYGQVADRLEELNALRHVRLLASRGQIPTPMWILLVTGAVASVGFSCIFNMAEVKILAGMSGLLAAGIAFTMFIIFALDTPYTGSFKIGPEPFLQVLIEFVK